MKLFVVLVLFLSGLSWGYTRTRSSAADVRSQAHGRGFGRSARSSILADRDGVSAQPFHPAEARESAVGSFPEPLGLLLFGALMFFLSWLCVAWASWKERHVGPVWESADSKIFAEAG